MNTFTWHCCQLKQFKSDIAQQSATSSTWIGLCSVLCPLQHSIGYMGDDFYRSKDPTNSIEVLKENLQKTNQTSSTMQSCTDVSSNTLLQLHTIVNQHHHQQQQHCKGATLPRVAHDSQLHNSLSNNTVISRHRE